MLKIPRFDSSKWVLIITSPIVMFLGFCSAGIGVITLLNPRNDPISEAIFYVILGLILMVIGVIMFRSGITPDDSPHGALSDDRNPDERLTSATTEEERELVRQEIAEESEKARRLTQSGAEILNKVKIQMLATPSPAEVIDTLGAEPNNGNLCANPDLQPVAFAMKPIATRQYVKGALLEASTWAGVFLSLPFILFLDVWRGGRAVLYAALRLSRRARQYRAHPFERLRSDKRPPILYLRPFSDDHEANLESYFPTTAEEKLVKRYKQDGPVVMIGEPADDIPVLGASRLYFEDDLWRTGVLHLMSISSLVIIQAGFAPGLLWELGIFRRRFEPQKLILSFAAWSELDDWKRYLNYLRFKTYAEDLLGCKLPADIKTTSHFSFEADWTPKPQSDFPWSIPSIRESHGWRRRFGTAIAIIGSLALTLSVGRPALQWTLEKFDRPKTYRESEKFDRSKAYTESTSKWSHYKLGSTGMSVDAPAEPQALDGKVISFGLEEYKEYGYGQGDLEASMGYLHFYSPMMRALGEKLLRNIAEEARSRDGVRNLDYAIKQDDKSSFALHGQLIIHGKEYKLLCRSFVKENNAWLVSVICLSSNKEACPAAERIISSVKIPQLNLK
ncbi:MAG: hypothetical protein ACKVX9_00270 [Blastocatellia bacterium]